MSRRFAWIPVALLPILFLLLPIGGLFLVIGPEVIGVVAITIFFVGIPLTMLVGARFPLRSSVTERTTIKLAFELHPERAELMTPEETQSVFDAIHPQIPKENVIAGWRYQRGTTALEYSDANGIRCLLLFDLPKEGRTWKAVGVFLYAEQIQQRPGEHALDT